jgi:hypothetical protein
VSVAVIAGALLSPAGCTTLPPLTLPGVGLPTAERLIAFLPDGASAYGVMTLGSQRPLVERVLGEFGMDSEQIGSALDRTEVFDFAIRNTGGKHVLFVAAAGNYPVGLIGFRLGTDPAWHRLETRYPCWRQTEGTVAVCFPSRSLAFMASASIDELLERAADRNAVESGRAQGDGAVISLPAGLPRAAISRLAAAGMGAYVISSNGDGILGFDPRRLPASAMTFTVAPGSNEGFDADAYLTMSSEQTARLYSVVLRVLILGSGGAMRSPLPFPLGGASLSVSGREIELTGIHLTESELLSTLSAALGAPSGGQS